MPTKREPGEATSTSKNAVLEALLHHSPLTRAELGVHTGLSRPSVSGTVAMLINDGIVDEIAGTENCTGRGRPSRGLRLSTRWAHALGIELGRRHVAIAVADITGTIAVSAARDIDPSSSLVDRVATALELLAAETTIARVDMASLQRVSVGTPGPRYSQPSEGRPPTDIPLARLARERALVVEAVAGRLGVPVTVGNNTRYTALGEATRLHNSGMTVEDLVYLRIDEGIGGGIITGGKLCAGAWDAAGEMGHISVDVNGAPCFCGGRGCLELVAALPAVMRASGATGLEDLILGATTEKVTASTIDDAATATGGVVAGVLSVINPNVLVVGGRVASLPGFLERLEEVVRATAPAWTTADLVFVVAETGQLLGAVGAAAHAGHNNSPLLHKRKT